MKARIIDELQLRSAMAKHDAWGGRLAHVVAEMGLADEERIVDTLALALKVSRVRLGNLTRDGSALAKLDVAFAEAAAVFPLRLRDHGKVLLLAMADPADLATIDEVSRRARARVVPYIAGEAEIRVAIARHYRGQEPVAPAPRRHSGQAVTEAPSAGAPSASELLDEILSGAPPESVFTEEELQRLHTVQANQEKSAKIVRAVMELLMEKRVLTPAAVRERMRS